MCSSRDKNPVDQTVNLDKPCIPSVAFIFMQISHKQPGVVAKFINKYKIYLWNSRNIVTTATLCAQFLYEWTSYGTRFREVWIWDGICSDVLTNWGRVMNLCVSKTH